MPPKGSSRHRPGFHALVLAIGFLVGGLFQQVARMWLPSGAVKEFFTTGLVTFSVGPAPLDLVIMKVTLGLAVDISLISVVGVLIAYLIARSLF